MDFISDIFSTNVAVAAASKTVAQFVGNINRLIVNPLIVLMFAASFVYFIYGVFQFQINKTNSGEAEDGKNHMLWGIVGMFIMFAVGGILTLIQTSLGLTPNSNLPGV